MIKKVTNSLLYLLIICLAITSCTNRETNWKRNYNYNSNQPMGTQLLYQSLDKLFPDAKIRYYKNNKSIESILYDEYYNESSNLVIIVADYFNPTSSELNALLEEVENGRQIFISANSYNEALLKSLQLNTKPISLKINDSIKIKFNQSFGDVSVQIPESSFDKVSLFSGIQPNDYIFTFSKDTAVAKQNARYHYWKHTNLEYPFNSTKPSYIAVQSEYGTIYLHHNPDLLCNNFLLQNQNYDYLNAVFGYIEYDPETVIFQSYLWSDTSQTDLKMLLRQPALKIAYTLVILLALIYLIVEVKNKQRIIPIINKDENSTAAFVKTVGHLYYNYGSNKDIATKMTQFFLENIRSKYNIDTQTLDQVFIEKYHLKSGNSKNNIETFLTLHKQIINTNSVDSYLLFRYHSIIQKISI